MQKLNAKQSEAIARFIFPSNIAIQTRAAISPSFFSKALRSIKLTNAQLTEIHKILAANA